MDSGLELDWQGRTPPEQRGEVASAGAGLAVVGAGKGPPGDPKHMGPEVRFALEAVLEGPSLTVRQLREWTEILTGWETRNRYEVFDANGRAVLLAGEVGEGLVASLARNFWPFRQVELEFLTHAGMRVLKVRRPWTLFFARFEVESWDGRPMGVIQQRFRFFNRAFDITTPGGVLLGTIEGPLFKPWTFFVKQHEREVATIRKRWSGLLQEAFTDADTFGVEFTPEATDGRLRQLVLAATLAIDLVYFEQRGGAGEGGLGGRRSGGLLGLVGSLFDD